MSEAKLYYGKSLEIREALAQETSTVSSYEDLAISYYKIGCLGDRNMMQSAYDTFKILADQCPQMERFSRYRDTIKQYL